MGTWDNALDELRIQLSDGPTDKYCWRKPLYPPANGKNTAFKTFEFRRITNFTQAASPLGIYLNNARIDNSQISADNVSTGDFILVTAPQDGDSLEATYYNQWFLDEELQSFLISASEWLLSGSDFTSVPEGLRPSAKKFACAEAYLKLAVKYSQRQSETYRVEDGMDPKTQTAVASFKDMAKTFKEEAQGLRDEYYTRSGQSLQPLNVSIAGRVRQTTPVT